MAPVSAARCKNDLRLVPSACPSSGRTGRTCSFVSMRLLLCRLSLQELQQGGRGVGNHPSGRFPQDVRRRGGIGFICLVVGGRGTRDGRGGREVKTRTLRNLGCGTRRWCYLETAWTVMEVSIRTQRAGRFSCGATRRNGPNVAASGAPSMVSATIISESRMPESSSAKEKTTR